jgi:hypothetical protein
MMGIPTLEECEIQVGSFHAGNEEDPECCDLLAFDLEGDEVVIAQELRLEDCRLVAHRCNTYDGLLAACEEGLRLGDIGVRSGLQFDMELADKFARENPDLAKIREVIAKAKGATP